MNTYISRKSIESKFWEDFNNFESNLRVFNFYGSNGVGKSTLVNRLSNELHEVFVTTIYLNKTTDVYQILESIRNNLSTNYNLQFPLFDYVENIFLTRQYMEHKKESKSTLVQFFSQVAGIKIPFAEFIGDVLYKISKAHKKANLEKEFSILTTLKEKFTIDSLKEIMVKMFKADLDVIRSVENERRFVIILEDYEESFDYIFKIAKTDGWLTNNYNGLMSNIGDIDWIVTSINLLEFKHKTYGYNLKSFDDSELLEYFITSKFIDSNTIVNDEFFQRFKVYTNSLPRNVSLLIEIMMAENKQYLDIKTIDKYEDSRIYLESFLAKFSFEEYKVVSFFACLGEWSKLIFDNILESLDEEIIIEKSTIKTVEEKLIRSGYLHKNGDNYLLEDHFVSIVFKNYDQSIIDSLYKYYSKISNSLIVSSAINSKGTKPDSSKLIYTNHLLVNQISKFKFICYNYKVVQDLILSMDLIGSTLEDAKNEDFRLFYESAYKLALNSYYIHSVESSINDLRNCTKVLARVYKNYNNLESKRYNMLFIEYSLKLLAIDFKNDSVVENYNLVEKDIFRFIHYLLDINTNDEEIFRLICIYYDNFIELIINYCAKHSDYVLYYRYMITRLKIGSILEINGRKKLAEEEYYVVASKTSIKIYDNEELNQLDQKINLYAIYRLHKVSLFNVVINKGGNRYIDVNLISKKYKDYINDENFLEKRMHMESILNKFGETIVTNDISWFMNKLDQKTNHQKFNSADFRDNIFHIDFDIINK